MADELDAEALRNSAGRELFTNPAKTIAARMTGRQVALAGDSAATVALARHGSSVLLRIAHRVVAAATLADAVVALRTAAESGAGGSSVDALFHDEQIDGPLPDRRLRVLALALADERTVVGARVAGLDEVDLVVADDVPDLPAGSAGLGGAGGLSDGDRRAELQLAVLAVRLEMAAVYLRLARG